MRRALAALALLLVVAGEADARPWAWLGVRIRDLSEQEMEDLAGKHGIREGFGVVIIEVLEGTPAAASGMKSGDIVVAFNDRPVTETRLLQTLIASAPVEEEVRLTVLRPEGRQQLPVRLVAMPRPVAGERVAVEFGFVIREPERQPERTLGGRGAGAANVAAVGFVVKGSPAERAGLEVGDVILQVNEQPVVGRDAAREALADAAMDRPLRLTVRRGEQHVTLAVGPASKP